MIAFDLSRTCRCEAGPLVLGPTELGIHGEGTPIVQGPAGSQAVLAFFPGVETCSSPHSLFQAE